MPQLILHGRSGIQTPVCAVSGAKFLTEAGWVDLRNPIDTDVPFRLFRDEGRTFLQWVGEPELRNKMSGRLVLIYLMCRELATTESATTDSGHTLFSPCVAFRVVGTPSRYLNNVSEVAFSADSQSSGTPDHLSVSEYVAIGICSVLLGLIYVASVFLYLHLRKRNREVNTIVDQNLTDVEEGIVKNNPLLTMVAHFQPSDTLYSDTTSSDTDVAPDIIQHHDDRKKNAQLTAALVHSSYKREHSIMSSRSLEINHQENSSIERLPEENVSIVETLEGREDRPDNLKALTGTVRRKLYFNPAYFEPQMLMAPPPAALEFLAKIREVINIAKQKMANKRFAPSLMGIPEEENSYSLDPAHDYVHSSVSRRSSLISLKRENSRRKTCTGCPGCEPQDLKQLCGRLPEFPSLAACHNCCTVTSAGESKQLSIRKWLEDVPILKQTKDAELHSESPGSSQKTPKRVRSPTRSLPPDAMSTPMRAVSPKPASERALSPKRDVYYNKSRSLTKPKQDDKSKTPLPPKIEEAQYDVIQPTKRDVVMNFPPPDMIHEAMVVDNATEETRIPTLTKKQMKAVIDELTVQQIGVSASPIERKKQLTVDYETDSLERTNDKGYSTPSEYAELSSSQPSPSLSTALPMDEEMTMRNAIYNKNTGNMTMSKINMDAVQGDEHEYELIVLKKGSLKKERFYKLPELLQRNNGYSLVSEVYVNNGYNYGSAPSSTSGSNSSTLEKPKLKIRYEEAVEKPGKLLIEVEDCPDNYIPVEDSDSFEPDTLDRKPSKAKIPQRLLDGEFVDSLERPQQILLKSSGSFKKEFPKTEIVEDTSGSFNRVFGSLREIYEAKTKAAKQSVSGDLNIDENGSLLTLEERHAKRQRQLDSLGGHVIPPDVIPPPHHDSSPIYEKPKPPRKIIIEDDVLLKPPLPSKNGDGRSANNNNQNTQDSNQNNAISVGTPGTNNNQKITRTDSMIVINPARKDQIVIHSSTPTPHSIEIFRNNKSSWKKLIDNGGRPEDSGYLSTDSSDSRLKTQKPTKRQQDEADKNSESEESLEEGHSESGAESVETHSVFFGSFRKPTPYLTLGSLDSGVEADSRQGGIDGEILNCYANVVSLTGQGYDQIVV